MSMDDNRVTVYLMSRDEVERLLATKYGDKLVAVNAVKLAKQNERREKWLKKC